MPGHGLTIAKSTLHKAGQGFRENPVVHSGQESVIYKDFTRCGVHIAFLFHSHVVDCIKYILTGVFFASAGEVLALTYLNHPL